MYNINNAKHIVKLKASLGAFCAIRQRNTWRLFYSKQDPQVAEQIKHCRSLYDTAERFKGNITQMGYCRKHIAYCGDGLTVD